MNLFSYLKDVLGACLESLGEAGKLPTGLDAYTVTVEPPRDTSHGDVATNAALVLAKQAKMPPREIADLIANELRARRDEISDVDVAGPGFINMRMTDGFWHARLAEVLSGGMDYGSADLGQGRAVNIEYVSANPTGPLHVGHGRGTVFGDVLANLLARVGYAVSREYYVNDAGAQVDTLGRAAHVRYLEALGDTIKDSDLEGLYPGDYLKPIGQALADTYGDRFKGQPEDAWLTEFRGFAVDRMMDLIRDDLDALGVQHDVFSSERALVDAGRVQEVFAELEERGLIYTGVLEPPKGKPPPEDWEARPQSLFRATDFGDEVDRPLKKSDGSWTYFATDIAYHRDKVQRGFNEMIDVWGADHGGYVKRMKAAVKAVSEGEANLDIKLCQLVKLLDKGEPVRMSKRAGQFVTLRDVVDRVGKDIVRFIMLTRKNDAPLDFDLTRVTEQSKDNPVYYVQYAHARVCSVLRNAAEEMPDLDAGPGALAKADLSRLTASAELDLIKRLASWPRVVESAAEAHEPHRLAFYLHDLAGDFHLLWNKGKDDPALRFIISSEHELTRARLALITALRTVVAAGLTILGVEPVEEMR